MFDNPTSLKGGLGGEEIGVSDIQRGEIFEEEGGGVGIFGR